VLKNGHTKLSFLLFGCAVGVFFLGWHFTAAFVFVGACLLHVYEEQVSRNSIAAQLENLYVLLALKMVPDWEYGVSFGAPSVLDVSYQTRLDAWERQAYISFLAKGMSVGDAGHATCDLIFDTYVRFIAEYAPERVKHGCKAGDLCPACSETLAEVTQQLEEAKQKNLPNRHWIIGARRCPLPKTGEKETRVAAGG
jgi:hypothetical protein